MQLYVYLSSLSRYDDAIAAMDDDEDVETAVSFAAKSQRTDRTDHTDKTTKTQSSQSREGSVCITTFLNKQISKSMYLFVR